MIEPKLEKGRGKGKQRKPSVSDSQARKTALVVALVLALIAIWNIYRVRFTVAAVLGGIAVLLTLIGLFVPIAARGFHRFWMGIAGVLGYVNSRILLTILYYGLLTPYGLVSRLVGSRSSGAPRSQPRHVLGEKRNNAPDAAAIRASFLKKTITPPYVRRRVAIHCSQEKITRFVRFSARSR